MILRIDSPSEYKNQHSGSTYHVRQIRDGNNRNSGGHSPATLNL
jgi:hypothetical protein